MSHKTEFKGYRKISNGQFAIDIVCCGEHEHPHTVGSIVMSDPDLLNKSISEAHRIASLDHEAARKLENHLNGLVGKTVEHA
jgi:hypothetical protein